MRRFHAAGSPLNNKVLHPVFVNRNRPTFAVPHKGANLRMNFFTATLAGRSFIVAKHLLIDEPPAPTATRTFKIPTGQAG